MIEITLKPKIEQNIPLNQKNDINTSQNLKNDINTPPPKEIYQNTLKTKK